MNDKHLNLDPLKDKKIGMLGFGAQGQAEARNLRRSGLAFRLGLRSDGRSFKQAATEGFEAEPLEKVAAESDILLLNLPDQDQASVYRDFIRGGAAKYLVFAHGFNTHFQLIPVEPEISHVLIAPKGAASGLEKLYGTSKALPTVLGFESASCPEPSVEERQWIECLALAIGAHPQALIWAQFKDECVCDLFAEQALLCGGVSSLLRKTYEVLVENGYHPETAYFETLYELKLIVDLIWEEGISGMRRRISPTARYGDLTRGDRVISKEVKQRMIEVLREVESGAFAKEFLQKVGEPEWQEKLAADENHPIERVGRELRERLRFKLDQETPGRT